MRKALVFVAASMLGACASASDLNVLYSRGLKAARKDDWAVAMKDLSQFTSATCWTAKPDQRCREAYLALARGHERAGAPAKAWASYDRALVLPPHERDAVVQESLQRVQTEVVDRLHQASEHGPVLLRYRDEVPDEYTLRSVTVTIDFTTQATRDKNAGELHSPDFTQLLAGPLAAGQHVLVVESVHDCKPGQDVPCTRSRLHRSFAFESLPKEPTTLEVRSYAEPGEGGAPATPSAALTTR
jgi:hypothetical protein